MTKRYTFILPRARPCPLRVAGPEIFNIHPVKFMRASVERPSVSLHGFQFGKNRRTNFHSPSRPSRNPLTSFPFSSCRIDACEVSVCAGEWDFPLLFSLLLVPGAGVRVSVQILDGCSDRFAGKTRCTRVPVRYPEFVARSWTSSPRVLLCLENSASLCSSGYSAEKGACDVSFGNKRIGAMGALYSEETPSYQVLFSCILLKAGRLEHEIIVE